MLQFELNSGEKKINIGLAKLKKIIFSEFKKSGKISIAFISAAKIKEYNKTYRQKDKSTDILTFVFDEGEYLGEIILSLKDVARRAKIMGKTLQETSVFLIVHGVLHIMGYTHKKTHDTAVMENKEKYLLKKLGYAPYNNL